MGKHHTLKNVKILVLRHQEESTTLSEILEHHGATLHFAPAIEIRPIIEGLAQVSPRCVENADVLIITSRHAVDLLYRNPEIKRIATTKRHLAIGPSTAQALRNHGVQENQIVVPAVYNAAGVVHEIQSKFFNKHLLYLKSEAADPFLSNALQGTFFKEIAIYRPENRPIAIDPSVQYHYIVFTSGSVVRSYFSQMPDAPGPISHVAMGKQTAEVIQHFASNILVASPSTQKGLATVILNHYTDHPL